MFKKTIISILTIVLLGAIWVTNAIQVFLPKDTINHKDYQTASEVVSWSRSYTDIIALVNSYLWFSIGFVCFLFMVWNWYQLIIARGDEKQMKSAKSALIGSALWLAVCILAYIIVNVSISIFG